MTRLGVTLVFFLTCLGTSHLTFASGGAAAALLILQQQHDQDEADPAPMPSGADGFVMAREWFVGTGGEFRICPTRINTQRIVARKAGCFAKIRHNDGFFALSWKGYHYEYEPVGNGQSLQEFLDAQVGPGLTEFVSIAPRGRHHQTLVVYYKLKNQKQISEGNAE